MGRTITVKTYTIGELVSEIQRGEILIPTFQRDVIWRRDQIANLWDSMYRSFPIGSLTFWQTPQELELIRKVGGFILSDIPPRPHHGEYTYVLDGQQRLTATYAAMRDGAGSIEADPTINYALFFDATAGLDLAPTPTGSTDKGMAAEVTEASEDEEGDEEEREEEASDRQESDDVGDDVGDEDIIPEKSTFFLFKRAANRRRVALTRMGLPQDLVVQISETKQTREARIARLQTQPGVPAQAIDRLKQLSRLLDEYRIPVELVSGLAISEVVDIFMRINRSGSRVESADIVIALLFGSGKRAFDLRKEFASIRDQVGRLQAEWKRIRSHTLMQMVGMCMREALLIDGDKKAASYGITSEQMLNLTPEALEATWERFIRPAILRAITFLIEEGFYQPFMLPASYMLMPLAAHFYRHIPDDWERVFLKQWIWRSAFDPASISTEKNIGEMRDAFFAPLRTGREPRLKPITIRRAKMFENADAKSALYKATLSFFSHLGPMDFDGGVFVTLNRRAPGHPAYGTPSVHHIFPKAFLDAHNASSKAHHRNALMNMCLINENTNQRIGDKAPADYYARYATQDNITEILASLLIPAQWMTSERFEPRDYAQFLEARFNLFITHLRRELPNIRVNVS